MWESVNRTPIILVLCVGLKLTEDYGSTLQARARFLGGNVWVNLPGEISCSSEVLTKGNRYTDMWYRRSSYMLTLPHKYS